MNHSPYSGRNIGFGRSCAQAYMSDSDTDSPKMTDHPLTDEMIHEMIEVVSRTDWNDCEDDEDSLLARRAADWQLEQVIKQWEEVINSNKTDIQVIREFDKRLKAMRPQEN